MSFTISPNGPPAKDTSSIRHRRCETRGERRRPARAHPDLPRPPSLQPRRAPPSSLRERRPGPKHWSHDRRVSGTRRWLPRTCAGLGTQFASVCSAAGVRRVRSEIVSDLGHAHEGVRPRKQHGDHLLRTLPIDRQTLSFQVGSDPHLYVSRAVRCFVMRAGDRAVRLAALHGERATWIQPVDSVDRRSDSSEVAGVTRQPYASTDRRKMLDFFIRLGQLRPCRDRHAGSVHGHRRRRDRIRHDCPRAGRIRARRDELGVEHHYVLFHRRERDADRAGRVFQSEVEGPVRRESSRKVAEVPTPPFGPERERCVDHGDRIAQAIKVIDGPHSHGQFSVSCSVGSAQSRRRPASRSPAVRSASPSQRLTRFPARLCRSFQPAKRGRMTLVSMAGSRSR